MRGRQNIWSRREWLGAAGLGLLEALVPGHRGVASPSDAYPRRKRNVERAFESPGPHPNGLAAADDGLWILDQGDNRAYKVRYEDGSVIQQLETESDRGSGIGFDGKALWLASTYDKKILKIDARTGETQASYPTPGAGKVRWGNPTQDTGAHGIECVQGKLWIAVPPSVTIYQIDPASFTVLHSVPAPGTRPHGLAWDQGSLWCAETNDRAVYKLDPATGSITVKIELSPRDPEPHGLAIHQGVLWYCDADTRDVCRIPT